MAIGRRHSGSVVFGLISALTVVGLVSLSSINPMLRGPADPGSERVLPDQAVNFEVPRLETVEAAMGKLGPNQLPTIDAPTCMSSSCCSKAPHQVTAPRFHPAPGSFPEEAFPLEITLIKKADDPADVMMFYSTEPDVWLLYEGPIRVTGDVKITAYAMGMDPKWMDSKVATASYLSENAAE